MFEKFRIRLPILEVVTNYGNEVNYVPRIVFHNQLKTAEKANTIWSIIQSRPFGRKFLWELSFYDSLDESLINTEYVLAMIETVRNITEPNIINFDKMIRFLKIEPNLFQIILKIIVEKNEGKPLQLINFFSPTLQIRG